jgi:hypothetical protein
MRKKNVDRFLFDQTLNLIEVISRLCLWGRSPNVKKVLFFSISWGKIPNSVVIKLFLKMVNKGTTLLGIFPHEIEKKRTFFTLGLRPHKHSREITSIKFNVI